MGKKKVHNGREKSESQKNTEWCKNLSKSATIWDLTVSSSFGKFNFYL